MIVDRYLEAFRVKAMKSEVWTLPQQPPITEES